VGPFAPILSLFIDEREDKIQFVDCNLNFREELLTVNITDNGSKLAKYMLPNEIYELNFCQEQ